MILYIIIDVICLQGIVEFWVAPARRPVGIKHMNHIE